MQDFMQIARMVWTTKCYCDSNVWNLAYREENRKLENSWYEWLSGIWLLLIMLRYV